MKGPAVGLPAPPSEPHLFTPSCLKTGDGSQGPLLLPPPADIWKRLGLVASQTITIAHSYHHYVAIFIVVNCHYFFF